jgi:predicted nucleotidyltransferase
MQETQRSNSSPGELLQLRGLAEAKSAILARYPNAQVILFGSRARGDFRTNSDIDLCVLIDHADRRRIDIMTDLHFTLSPIFGIALDLVVYERSNFSEREIAGATFERMIAREGIAV